SPASGSVTFINLATMSVVSTLKIVDAFDMAVDSVRHRAVVTAPTTSALFVIDLQTRALSFTIPLTGIPAGIDILPDLGRLLVVDTLFNRLVAYDYSPLEVNWNFVPGTPLRVRVNPSTRSGVVTTADRDSTSVTLFRM